VRVFLSAPRKMRIPPELVDLGLPGSQDTIAAREDPALWNIPDLAALSEAP
jgi:hypothetical protein